MAIYSDVNQYDPQSKPVLFEIEPIYQSIHNILATRKTERLFNPEFGSSIKDVIFEPIDDVTEQLIFNRIIEAIEKWEPRVIILYSESGVEALVDEHKFNVTIAFKVRGYEEVYEFKGVYSY